MRGGEGEGERERRKQMMKEGKSNFAATCDSSFVYLTVDRGVCTFHSQANDRVAKKGADQERAVISTVKDMNMDTDGVRKKIVELPWWICNW